MAESGPGEIDQNNLGAVLTLRAHPKGTSFGAPAASKTLTRFVERSPLDCTVRSLRPQKNRDPTGSLYFLARPERFELPTARFVAGYSIQLSYGRIVSFSNSVAEREGFEPSKGY